MDDQVMEFDLDEVLDAMSGADMWWAIGGGWAVDLHLGERGRRPHKDVDVVCLEPEAELIRSHLDGWDLHRVIDGELHPWDEDLAPAHQIWTRTSPDTEWAFEVLFESVDGGTWRFRRNPLVTLPLDSLATIVDGIPTMNLAVELLYKAKRDADIDFEDLLASLLVLEDEGRRWLAESITSSYGPDHRWVSVLR